MPYNLIFYNSDDKLMYRIGPVNTYAEAMETFNRLAEHPEVSTLDLYSSYITSNEPVQSYKKKK